MIECHISTHTLYCVTQYVTKTIANPVVGSIVLTVDTQLLHQSKASQDLMG